MMLELAVRVASVVSPTPSPSIPANPYLDAVEEWPDPPGWMFVAVRVLAVIAGLVVLATLVAAASSWRTKRSEASQRPQATWIDLSQLESRTSGVDRRDDAPAARATDGRDERDRDARYPDDDDPRSDDPRVG